MARDGSEMNNTLIQVGLIAARAQAAPDRGDRDCAKARRRADKLRFISQRPPGGSVDAQLHARTGEDPAEARDALNRSRSA